MHNEANNSPEAVIANVNNDVATPAPAKPAAKRAPKPKAVKPATPAPTEADAMRARCIANRALIAPHYTGASSASHASRAPKLADALARITTPIQRAKSATVRDESALLLLSKRADKSGTFCPVDCTADLGTLSRLASLKLIVPHNDKRAKLTKAGRDLAALVAKRA